MATLAFFDSDGKFMLVYAGAPRDDFIISFISILIEPSPIGSLALHFGFIVIVVKQF